MSRRVPATRAAVRVPLSVPSSRSVAACYAAQGKGQHHCAWVGARIELVLVNEARVMRVVEGVQIGTWRAATSAVGAGDGWRILGWRMADGSALFGDYDRVDPELADFGRLQEPWALQPVTAPASTSLPTLRNDDVRSPPIQLDGCNVR